MENKLDNVIKSISYNQHEILYNIMQLYNDGKPFDCDMTYSKGNFYGKFQVKKSNSTTEEIVIPAPKYKFDVYPQTEDTIQIEPLKPLPLEDNSIESIVIDLPFVISPPSAPSMKENKQSSNIIMRRFASFYPANELYKSYAFWIKEAYRVLKENGTLIFKTQQNVSGGIVHDTPYWSKLCAHKVGFVNEDEFILNAKARLISSKVKKQVHARKFHSQFLVFKKYTSKKYDKVNYINLIDDFLND